MYLRDQTSSNQTHFKRKAHVKILLARIIIEKLDGRKKKLDGKKEKARQLPRQVFLFAVLPYSIRADLQRDSIYMLLGMGKCTTCYPSALGRAKEWRPMSIDPGAAAVLRLKPWWQVLRSRDVDRD